MLTQTRGTRMEHRPYRGVAPAMADVLSGRVPIIFGSLSSGLENIKAGKLRPLGVSSAQRTGVLPDVPAISEKIPGFRSEMWVALYAPAATPGPIIAKLHKTAQVALSDPKTNALFQGLVMSVIHNPPAKLAQIQKARKSE